MLLAARRLKVVLAAKYFVTRLAPPTRTFSGGSDQATSPSLASPTSLRACLFIELAALAEAVDSYALETHGPRYSSRFALDLSALVPSLQAQAKDRVCGGRPVQIVRTFVYGVSASSSLSSGDSNNGGVSSSHSHLQQSALDRSRFNTFRACTNEGYSMRVFHAKSDPIGFAGFAAAVALSADVVHACAPPPPLLLQTSAAGVVEQGPLNTGDSTIPSASAVDPNVASGSGYDIVVGLVGGSAFLPPLIRAAQHGKGVLMATRFSPDFSAAWRERPTVFKSLVDAIPLESITPKLIIPFNDFRQGASLDVAALVDKLAVYFASRFGPEASVTGSALGKAAAAAGIAKDLSRHRLSIRALVGRAPHVFVVSEESGGTNTNYSVRLVKQKKASNIAVSVHSRPNDSISTKEAESTETQSVVSLPESSISSSGQEAQLESVQLESVQLESTQLESIQPGSITLETTVQEINDVSQESSSASMEPQESPVESDLTTSREENTNLSTSNSLSVTAKAPRKKKKKNAPAPSSAPSVIEELYLTALASGLVSPTKDSGSKTSLLALIKATLSLEKQPKSSATKADLVALLESNLAESQRSIAEKKVV